MTTFAQCKLSDVLRFKNGKSVRPGGSGRYPVYGSNGIIGGTDEPIEANGIIIGRVGAYCGSIMYEAGRFWASDNTVVAYPKDKRHDVRFLAYLLDHLKLNRWAGGAAQPLMTQTVLKSIETHVPSLIIQRKIASMLSTYDDLIENNLRRIKILEEMAHNLYREWFVNFRFPGHEKARMVDSELGLVPKSWRILTLNEIMDFQGGAQPPKSEWIYEPRAGYVRILQIRDYDSEAHVSFVKDSKKLRKCRSDDIMIARYGASVGRVCWGLSGAYNVALVRVVPLKPLYKAFLGQFLRDHYFQTLLIGMSGRTAQAGFNKSNLKSIKLPFPDEGTILARFGEIICSMDQSILNLREKNHILRTSRDLLLPKLISGELDVSELDIEIPESAA